MIAFMSPVTPSLSNRLDDADDSDSDYVYDVVGSGDNDDDNDDNDDSAAQPIAAVRVDALGQSLPHYQVVPFQARREEKPVPSENSNNW